MYHPMLLNFLTDSLEAQTQIPVRFFPGRDATWQSHCASEHPKDDRGNLESDSFRPSKSQISSRESLRQPIPTETSFFRDVDVFEALRKTIFPELLKRRGSQRRLNLWSAACSSGQEPYSLALLLQAYFPLLTHWQLKFFASDVSDEMLARSREGCYSQSEVERRLPPQLLRRYFRQQGDSWCIADEIRLMVEFHQIDLLEKWPSLPKMDLILMRNVLIYFNRSTRRRILQKVRHILKPDGYLFLGATETPFSLDRGFVPVQIGRAIAYQLCQNSTDLS
jgi:chemotaxis protein methyltransferase CheR